MSFRNNKPSLRLLPDIPFALVPVKFRGHLSSFQRASTETKGKSVLLSNPFDLNNLTIPGILNTQYYYGGTSRWRT